MTRQRRRNGRNGRRRNGGNGGRTLGGITSVAFHRLNVETLSGVTGIVQFPVNPNGNLLAGLNEVADQFDLFRVTRLSYRIHPMDPSDTVNQVAAYYPDIDIQTQSIAQASESPVAAVQTRFCGVPSPWIHVPASQLRGMIDWYKCTADSGAAEFESQGMVQCLGGLSDVLVLEVRGICQFKNPVSSSLQFERTIERAVRDGLVKRLPRAHPPVPTPPTTPEGAIRLPSAALVSPEAVPISGLTLSHATRLPSEPRASEAVPMVEMIGLVEKLAALFNGRDQKG